MKALFTRENAFLALSLAFAGVFGWGFFIKAGFPPTRLAANWQSLVVFMIFLILPFARKLDFFQFFTFEAKIDEVRKEVGEAAQKVSDVKEDIRHLISLQNNLSNSVSLMNSHTSNVHVSYPDRPKSEEVREATNALSYVTPTENNPGFHTRSGADDELMQAIFGAMPTNDQLRNTQVNLSDLFQDLEPISAVRRLKASEHVGILRIRIERELRRLTAGLKTPPSTNSARSLAYVVMKYYNEHIGDQHKSFDVFFRIANPAVHGVDVPLEDLDVARSLGERLLSLLSGLVAIDEGNITDGQK